MTAGCKARGFYVAHGGELGRAGPRCRSATNKDRRTMADKTGLRFIGLTFGAVTAAVMLMAAIAVMNVERAPAERSVAAASVAG